MMCLGLNRKKCVLGVVAMMTLTMMISHVQAGAISTFTWYSGVASVAGTSWAPPVAPNNDNVVGASPNAIFVTQKDYVGIGPVDLVFDVINTGGVTEYVVTEGVQNNTGLDWSSYHIELGFGQGAGFVKSTPGDGLDFDAPHHDSPVNFNPSPGFFPTVTYPTEDDILATGGLMPDFTFAGYFVFNIDVPDGISSFTIRQSPIAVPEPATMSMLVLGSVALLKRRRTH